MYTNIGKERVYISGDTEDIPEMRKLKNIDHAFVCMNLPYTMSVEQAASAIAGFKPVKCVSIPLSQSQMEVTAMCRVNLKTVVKISQNKNSLSGLV